MCPLTQQQGQAQHHRQQAKPKVTQYITAEWGYYLATNSANNVGYCRWLLLAAPWQLGCSGPPPLQWPPGNNGRGRSCRA